MEEINEFKGINVNLLAFKEAVGDAAKITFAGTPGVCTPFAELFAYVMEIKNPFLLH